MFGQPWPDCGGPSNNVKTPPRTVFSMFIQIIIVTRVAIKRIYFCMLAITLITLILFYFGIQFAKKGYFYNA